MTVTIADLEVGAELPERVFTITRDDLIRYAGASGDFNPIHYSDRVAGAVGLPGVIAHGMLTMALGATAITDWVGNEASVIEYGVRFSKPVVVPDEDEGTEVRFTGTVAKREGDGSVRLDLTARSGDDKVLTQARARIRPAHA